MEEAIIARVAKNSAWRSLWTIWVEQGAGLRPARAQTYSSTFGSILAKVPTAPEILPYETVSIADSIRRRLRRISSYQRAILMPKVTGSAWIPWDRPIIAVSLCSYALFFSASISLFMPSRMRRPLSLRSMAKDVSRTSEEVIPTCRKRESSPI